LFRLIGAKEVYHPERGQILVAESPSEVVERFFERFNDADEFSLDEIFDRPWFLITGNKARVFQSYSEAIDFQFLRNSGWRHSRINRMKSIHQDHETSLIAFNFSRLSKENQEIYRADATHLLIYRAGGWKIKTVFINGEMTLSLD
jgi:hypothetical protein